jgi:tetratricopeptide (TPR) repeat protein
MPKQTESPKSRRKWRVRIVSFMCTAGIIVFGAPYVGIHFAEQALTRRDANAAITWLDWAAIWGSQKGRIEFLRARSLRRLGSLDGFRLALTTAAEHGYSKEALDREQVLLMAQMGQLRHVEHRIGTILRTVADDAAEVCEAYTNGLLVNLRQTEALNVVDHWAKDYPHDAQPEVVRGLILKSINRVKRAEDAFRKAVALDADSVDARRELGAILLDSRRLDEALVIFERFKEDSELRDFALLQISKCHRQRGDLTAAEQALAALSERPSLPAGDIALQYGLLCLDRQRFEEAMKYLTEALAAQPRAIEAQHATAQALRGLGRFEEAAIQSQLVAEAETELSRIGSLHDQVVAHPSATEPRLEIAKIELRYGNPHRGLVCLKGVLNIQPDHLETLETLAEYYEASKETNDELAVLADEYRKRAATLQQPHVDDATE